MAFLPQPPFPKSRGDSIRSADWNDLVLEVQRLDNAKVERAGDKMTGPLSVTSLGVGTTADADVLLRVQSADADRAPLLQVTTPNNEDFLSLFGGRRQNQLPFLAWKRGDLRLGTATSAAGLGFKELLRVNSSDSAPARLELDGRVRAGQLTVGAWPNNPAQYVFFGANTLDQTQAGNYALLQGTGTDVGTTYLNSPKTVRLRINNADKLVVQANGNVDLVPPGALNFGALTRQMINLWQTSYGIGVQNSTLYYRTGGHFAWYTGSSHNDNTFHPGAGGRTLMRLDVNGNLLLRGGIFVNQNFNDPPGGIIFDPGGVILDPGPVFPSDARLKRDIEPLEGALDRLLALRGVTFQWIDGSAPGPQIGLIAQEVEQVFPQWVQVGDDGNRRLAIRGFEALAIESLRELKLENDELRAQNQALAARVGALEVRLHARVGRNGAH